jgi:Icc-related predicted phosphoesterase
MAQQWILITMMLVFAYNVAAASYVRPPARKALSFWGGSKKVSDAQQVHISLAGPKHMRVSWMSPTNAKDKAPVVQYGLISGNYTSTAIGTSESYSFLLYSSGTMNHVVIGPLQDSTTYYYKCGGAGEEYEFKTPPPLGPNVPIKLAIAGDLGQTGWTKSTLEHIGNSKYDLLLLAGDLAYADYYQPYWDSYGELVEPYASARPWMVTSGNHDIEVVPILVEGFRSFNTRWQMPHKESGSDSNLYYSFEVAGVHVIMLGSYVEFDEGSDQHMWLQLDLMKVDRSRTPWVIVVLHAPWYNTNHAHQGNGDDMKQALEQILYEANVDIVIGGHVHAYERTTRVYANKVDPCGIMHITVGDGGNREGLARKFYENSPDWSVFREASFGHAELEIVNATHAHWTWHRNDDDESVLADEFWITSLSAGHSECSFEQPSTRRILKPNASLRVGKGVV